MPHPGGRDPAIDAVRGLALFGILISNITFFAMPGGVAGEWWRETYPGWADWGAAFAIRAFFENSFILIFSFLFGYGAARQLRGSTPGRFRRRLIGLGVIGVLHALLFWAGDILLAYALIGAMLPLAVRWPMAKLFRVIVLLWAIAILGNTAVGVGLAILKPPLPDPAAAIALYSSGDFGGILMVRLLEWAEFYGFGLIVLMPLIAAAFLTGAAAEGWLAGRQPSELKQLEPEISRFIFWPALSGRITYGLLAVAPASLAGGALLMPEIITRAVFSPLFALLLLGLFIRFFTSTAGQRVLEPFRVNGQLSLSIYAGQSIACVLLFHGYGLGLYGSIGPLQSLVVALALFAAMTGAAWAWQRILGQGPLERVMALAVGPRRQGGEDWRAYEPSQESMKT